jgi:hypothetical protein
MDDHQLDCYLDQCCEWLEQRQQYFVREFDGFGCNAVAIDLDRGVFEMSNRLGYQVMAQIVPIGSYSLLDGTWRWAWADPDISQSLQIYSGQLQALSRITGLTLFEAPAFQADESLTHELTALACHHVNAQGCYRLAQPYGFLMLALKNINTKETIAA